MEAGGPSEISVHSSLAFRRFVLPGFANPRSRTRTLRRTGASELSDTCNRSSSRTAWRSWVWGGGGAVTVTKFLQKYYNTVSGGTVSYSPIFAFRGGLEPYLRRKVSDSCTYLSNYTASYPRRTFSSYLFTVRTLYLTLSLRRLRLVNGQISHVYKTCKPQLVIS
jgi:hypothetical protein